MKNNCMLFTLLAAGLAVAGCDKSGDQSDSSIATNSAADVTVSASYWDSAYARKEAFLAGARADLDALDRKIKDISDRTANAAEAGKADAQAKLQALQEKRSDLDKKFAELKDATEDRWNDLKAGFRKNYEEVKSSLKQSGSDLKN